MPDHGDVLFLLRLVLSRHFITCTSRWLLLQLIELLCFLFDQTYVVVIVAGHRFHLRAVALDLLCDTQLLQLPLLSILFFNHPLNNGHVGQSELYTGRCLRQLLCLVKQFNSCFALTNQSLL